MLNNESIGEIISLDDYINPNGRSCYKINSIHFDEANFQIDNFLKYFIDIMMAMIFFFILKTPLKPFKIVLVLDICLEEDDVVIEYDEITTTHTEIEYEDANEETNQPTILAGPIFNE